MSNAATDNEARGVRPTPTAGEVSVLSSPSPVRAHLWPTARTEYDAIVVGARIAGAATAYQLARRGWRVALLDKADRPLGPTLSVPTIYPRALARFRELGLEPVIDALRPYCATIRTFQLRFDDAILLHGQMPPSAGYDAGIIVRRELLDEAVLAFVLEQQTPGSITFLPRHRVEALRFAPSGQVIGVRVASRPRVESVGTDEDVAPDTELRAPLVVGADGRHSTVARLLGKKARAYQVVRPSTTFCYTYCRGADVAGLPDVTFTPRDSTTSTGSERRMLALMPISDDLQLLGIYMPVEAYAAFRRPPPRSDTGAAARSPNGSAYPNEVLNSAGATQCRTEVTAREFYGHHGMHSSHWSQQRFLATWTAIPELAARLHNVELIGKVLGVDPAEHGYLRPAGGPGFALVGDAAHYEDPAAGQGIHNSLLTVQVFANALDELTGGFPLSSEQAGSPDWQREMRRAQRTRDAVLLPMYRFANTLSRLLTRQPSGYHYALLRCLAENPALLHEFLGLSSGATAITAFERRLPAVVARRFVRHPLGTLKLFTYSPPGTP